MFDELMMESCVEREVLSRYIVSGNQVRWLMSVGKVSFVCFIECDVKSDV